MRRFLLLGWFTFLASLNLLVLIQSNLLAFSQSQQPYDFYVLLHASSQIFSAPTQLYVHQGPNTFGPYWSSWLWDGATYLYTPMFAVLLSPLSLLYPPAAKIVWEALSYALLVIACAATLMVIPSIRLRFFLSLMIFIMPIQILYTDQTLPQYWLPQMPGMWLSPVFFADYYWGNTNASILSLGLLSYYFGVRTKPLDLRVVKIPSNVLSSFFLALDSFKVTALLLLFPFWLALNRKRALNSLGFLILFLTILNSIAIFEPSIFSGYFSAMLAEPTAALWQVYEYVWYYTLPVVGIAFLLSRKRVQDESVVEDGQGA